MAEKRKRMVLKSEDMPDDVYKILNEHAFKRSLTPYVIELVKKSLQTDLIFEKLSTIENKIDNISISGITKNIDAYNENESELLKEGLILDKFTNVEGGIDKSDKQDYDF